MPDDSLEGWLGRELLYEASALLSAPFSDIRRPQYRSHGSIMGMYSMPHASFADYIMYLSVSFERKPPDSVRWEGIDLHFLYEGVDSGFVLNRLGQANTRRIDIPEEAVPYSLYLMAPGGERIQGSL